MNTVPLTPPGFIPAAQSTHPSSTPAPEVAPLVPPPASPTPPVAAPAMHGYNPQLIHSAPVPVAMLSASVPIVPDLSAITDIEVPDVNSVHVHNFEEFVSKLEVRDPDPQLEYRWVNSDIQRYTQLFTRGWRPVRNKARATSEVEGSETPELFAGTDQHGAGRRAVLMAIPKVYREQRNAAYRELIKKNQAALDPKQYSGNNGTTDNASYTGQLSMGGSINP